MFDKKKVWIVAEMSANHCQDFSMAVDIVQAAKWAGADAIKVQMFRADEMTYDRDDWVIKDMPWKGRKLYDLYKEAAMPYDWVPILKSIAEELGLLFFTSVYGLETVDIAIDMGIEAIKIASFEIPYTDLIRKAGKTGKTVLLSTGGSDYRQIWAAKQHLYQVGCKDYWMLHCVSEYPAKEMNLRTMTDMHRLYQGRVGLSDHSLGWVAPVVATGYGARIIEKHLMLEGTPSLDAGFSLIPSEFREMVENIRLAEQAEGVVKYGDGKGPYRRREVNGQMVRVV